ncbi:MAG: hypothetical protein H6656_10165 [Ardenticatenaceae bacterium]|nr:hypothetical protein [Ardenticatenaceae bacterium]
MADEAKVLGSIAVDARRIGPNFVGPRCPLVATNGPGLMIYVLASRSPARGHRPFATKVQKLKRLYPKICQLLPEDHKQASHCSLLAGDADPATMPRPCAADRAPLAWQSSLNKLKRLWLPRPAATTNP